MFFCILHGGVTFFSFVVLARVAARPQSNEYHFFPYGSLDIQSNEYDEGLFVGYCTMGKGRRLFVMTFEMCYCTLVIYMGEKGR